MARTNFTRVGRTRPGARARRPRQFGTVPLPPMPSDPGVCRWCGGRLMELVSGGTLCPYRCTAADQPLLIGQCDDCGREFRTGRFYDLDQCWQCRDKEMNRSRQDIGGVNGYLKDSIRAGMRAHSEDE